MKNKWEGRLILGIVMFVPIICTAVILTAAIFSVVQAQQLPWVLLIHTVFSNDDGGHYAATTVVVPGIYTEAACHDAAEFYETRMRSAFPIMPPTEDAPGISVQEGRGHAICVPGPR